MKEFVVNNTKHRDLLEFPVPNKVLEYVKFSKDGILCCYRNEQNNFSVSYDNIINMKLIILSVAYQVTRAYPIKGFILDFTIRQNDKKYHIKLINEENEIVDRIFKVVYFSKFIKNFLYDFRNNKKDSAKFNNAIRSYIENNYKHTFYSIGCTKWALLLEIVFFLLLISLLFLVGWFITKYSF